ncbi:hypothetical protein [Zooshikella ganghwensis]|uniref:hypothetical protein n=1 Tax=Zooshikella ganghwensis TaxID=202772 RepID=UPI0004146E1B|nr:hypothetical protein [Zooshikella ganghwensis]
MDKKLFDELLASVKEANEIIKGKKASPRVSEFPESKEQTVKSKKRWTTPPL